MSEQEVKKEMEKRESIDRKLLMQQKAAIIVQMKKNEKAIADAEATKYGLQGSMQTIDFLLSQLAEDENVYNVEK